MKDKFVGFAIILICALLLFGILFPSSKSGNISKYQEREILFKQEIKRKALEIRRLKSRDSVGTIRYEKMRDSLISSTKIIHDNVIVYRKAVEATDLRPDSINLLNEVRIGRKIIVAQEAHVNALLALSSEADKLLASKVAIIGTQDTQIELLIKRFDNMVAQKNGQIKKERRRGNGKFLKGLGIGAAIMAVLAL